MLNGKAILITGGTGSFGKKMVQVILQDYKPKKLIVFSRDELKQFEMSQCWNPRYYSCLRYFLGDVRDSERLKRALKGIDYVIHAAALKQVPASEYNPEECIKTNILGAMNVIDAALYNNVQKVIALSTDKACNPVNLYGATKLCSDKLFTAGNVYRESNEIGSVFSVVRYGNVVGSRGSVVPFFKERAQTGVLPITDERMTRFWITLDQGVHFVLQVLGLANGGEIFVPKIPATKITDLATAIAPECKQEIVGIRPGEKIHETLIGENEGRNTIEYENYYIVFSETLGNYQNLPLQGRGRRCSESFKYTSDTNTQNMSIKELRDILKRIENDYNIENNRWSLKDIPS